jgi:hypothetical protein
LTTWLANASPKVASPAQLLGARVERLHQPPLGRRQAVLDENGGEVLATERQLAPLLRLRPRAQRQPLVFGRVAFETQPEQPIELHAGSEAGRGQRGIEGGKMRLDRRRRLPLAGDPSW